jgi:deoxyribodipyrimidine photo-lyase
MRPIILWLRRDLRTDDQAALYHATRTGAPVIPLFLVDTDLIRHLPADGTTFDFQKEALTELGADLAALGGKLIIRHGHSLEVHKHLIRETQPAALYFNRDYEPYAIERDARVIKLYEQHDIEVRTFNDALLQEPTEVLTREGNPYVVFTPFARAWKHREAPVPLGSPAPFSTPPLISDIIPGADSLKRARGIPEPLFRGGAKEARRRWESFLAERSQTYGHDRDFPALPGTSRLSPYLRFGCISIRRIAEECRHHALGLPETEAAGLQKYVDELIWREFYQAVLFHFPRLLSSNYRQEFDRFPWKFDEGLFTSWREGRTGFPLVDAGMRELNRTGWMHNRIRMVVASFLTKDLMHDWRLGEKVFEEKLMDIETASNNGGWQWAASTGVDPRPLRIFNPRLQSERFDPAGNYIRLHVPELRAVPDRYIHAPQGMPPALQESCGCIIGRDYPPPIVDHAAASAAYKEAFALTKQGVKQISEF